MNDEFMLFDNKSILGIEKVFSVIFLYDLIFFMLLFLGYFKLNLNFLDRSTEGNQILHK